MTKPVTPSFLLIGAQKAGTTWLAAMLGAHPDVFVPPTKELHVFNLKQNHGKGMDWYRRQFEGYAGERAVGECTPNYLWTSDAPESVQAARERQGHPRVRFRDYPFLNRNIPELVHRELPDLQLIVSLRNPVDRAISRYYHSIRARKFSPRSRLLDVGGTEGILGMGFYYRHLVDWFRCYPRERFLILIYEDELAGSRKIHSLGRVYRHLGVDDSVTPQNLDRRYNVRSGHLFMHLNYYAPRLAKRLKRFEALQRIQFPRIRVSDEEMEHLYSLYHDENRRLEDLLGRSLSIWSRDRTPGEVSANRERPTSG
jgi:hypothetical protein